MDVDRLSDSSSDDAHALQTRACPSSRSSASMGCVADLVFWHLPVRNLVQLKVLSKEWRAWCEGNLLKIAKEQRRDDSKSDWYFPLAFENRRRVRQRGLPGSWKWHGIHQGTKEQHTLPGLDFLPSFSHSRFDYALEAVSSGLLVLRKSSPHNNSFLIVCNPLSKKWKSLPGVHADCQGRWKYHGSSMHHTHLVLGDLPNEYMVIRLSTDCINVYNSSTERWVCAPFDHHYIGFSYLSSVYFKGHVYILKMMEVVPFSGTLRWSYNLRIYDIESGRYATKNFISSTVVTLDCNENYLESPRDPTLVACMGNLYAIAASCQAGRNHVKPRERHETYFANCEIYIFTLTEEGKLLDDFEWKHVVTVPVVLLSVKQHVVEFWEACRDFNCVARSNTICVAWSSRRRRDGNFPAHYLEYDVVSRHHTIYKSARAHLRQPFREPSSCACDMAYTPCLDLEP